MAKLTESYLEDLHERLREPEEAANYIAAAIEEGDMPTFLLALRDVAESRGVSQVAKKAGLNRENLYRILSEKGNPTLSSLFAILEALGSMLMAAQVFDQLLKHAPIHKPASQNLPITCEVVKTRSIASAAEYYSTNIIGGTGNFSTHGKYEGKSQPLAA